LASSRDTITTGLVFAANPKSANQTSPGCGLIKQVEDVLFDSTRAHQIENVMVGEVHNLGQSLPYLSRCFRLPLAQFGIQPLNQRIHGGILPTFSLAPITRSEMPRDAAMVARRIGQIGGLAISLPS
jgi:hypothetical protein